MEAIKCSKCHNMTPVSGFRYNNMRQKLNSVCTRCVRIMEKASCIKHAAARRLRGRNAYYLTHKGSPLSLILKNAKVRARRKNIEFSITLDDVYCPTHCPVFGMELQANSGKVADNSFSLDRIDNTKGYIKGNVIIVSWLANKIKNQFTVAQLNSVVQFYQNLNPGEIYICRPSPLEASYWAGNMEVASPAYGERFDE